MHVDLDWGVIDFTPLTDFPTPRSKNIIQSPLAGALGVSILIKNICGTSDLKAHALQYLPRPNGTARVYVMLGEGKQENVQNTDPIATISEVGSICS